MSASDNSSNISIKVQQEFLDDFDRTLKRLQVEGEIPLNLSRSEAVRRAMKAAVEDPSILVEVEADEE